MLSVVVQDGCLKLLLAMAEVDQNQISTYILYKFPHNHDCRFNVFYGFKQI